MPGWKYITFCALFLLSLLLIGIAWGAGIELYLGRRGPIPAVFVFAIVAVAAVMTLRFYRAGVAVCTVVAVAMTYSSILASQVGRPTPGIMQYLVIAALGATSVYGWAVREYLED